MEQDPQPTAMFRAAKYIADHVSADEFQFPAMTALALRLASPEFAALRPPPRLSCDQVMREMGGDRAPDDAFMFFVEDACADDPRKRESFLLCAAHHGRTIACQALLDAAPRGSFRSASVCAAAAGGGHMATLQWALSAGFPLHTFVRYSPGYTAARGGHTEMVHWLFDQADPSNSRLRLGIANGAANGGHLPLLKWAVEQRGCDASGTAYHAAMGGHMEVLAWAFANGSRVREAWKLSKIAFNAAETDNLPVLQWAVAQGAELTGVVIRASDAGSLRVLQWAHEEGCDLYEGSKVAAHKVNFEFLDFLKARGALHPMACWRSMKYNPTNPGLVEWLLRNAGDDVPKADVMELAYVNKDAAHVRLLHARGFPIDKKRAFLQVIGPLGFFSYPTPEALLDFLHSVGCVPTNLAMTRAARQGDMGAVKWLHARGFRVLPGKRNGTTCDNAREWLEANGAFGGHPRNP